MAADGGEHVATNAGLWPDPFDAARGDDATGPDLASIAAAAQSVGVLALPAHAQTTRQLRLAPDPRVVRLAGSGGPSVADAHDK